MLKAAPNFAAQQQKLNGQEPIIKNNPALGEYQLIDDLGGLMHGTYLQATNSESHAKDRSLVSRNSMSETASLVNYRAATDFSGYGHLKNNTETTKSVEVVYTLPIFEGKQGTAQVVLDGARINEFDGLEYKDEKGNVIPGFDITYSYQGHEGEYSTIDTLKQRDDFSWEKVTAIMVFGSLLPNSSYRVEFPFKIVIVDNELPQNARLMAEDGEQEKEYKIIISKQNSQVQQITVFYVDIPDDRLPIVKPSSGRIIDNRTQRLNVTEGQTYNNKLWDFESAGYELFKADKGALKGKYFAGSPEQQYYVYLTHQTTPLKKEHHVTRTIQITMPDQTQQLVTQEAIVTRFGVHDEVLGSDIWQEWSKEVLPEYIPTPIDGYDTLTIPAEQVDENASDRSEKIVYTPQTAKIQVKFIDQTGTELVSKELIGKTGEEFDYDPTSQIKSFEAEGYVLDKNTVPADHHFLAGTQTYVINLKKLVAVTPHDNSETESTIEQIKSTDDEKTENKKGIFAAFKGYFK